jgi:hypothetical protein
VAPWLPSRGPCQAPRIRASRGNTPMSVASLHTGSSHSHGPCSLEVGPTLTDPYQSPSGPGGGCGPVTHLPKAQVRGSYLLQISARDEQCSGATGLPISGICIHITQLSPWGGVCSACSARVGRPALGVGLGAELTAGPDYPSSGDPDPLWFCESPPPHLTGSSPGRRCGGSVRCVD